MATVLDCRNSLAIKKGGVLMENDKQALAECFWLEISKAIVNSQNVKDCLHSMKDMGMVEFLTRHDYILDGRLLIKRILDAPNIRVTGHDTSEDSKQRCNEVTKNLIQNFEISLN